MSSLMPDGIIRFLLYLILKYGVAGGRICKRYGAGELLINLTLSVCVLRSSKPANLHIEGLAPNRPFVPTASNLLFKPK